MEADTGAGVSRAEKKALDKAKIVHRETERNVLKTVTRILKKAEDERTEEEARTLLRHPSAVEQVRGRSVRSGQQRRRREEVCDGVEELRTKVSQLAAAVRCAQHLVVYTGAGISTAASIPDYRGPNGVWTQLQKGQAVSSSDLGRAEPTLTHMCIKALHQQNLVCASCIPAREYVRVFDVTERTALRRHATGRRCGLCGAELRDTIVHFGERGTLEQPLNWSGAAAAAGSADLILCLGSSLKVLKKYACLWSMNRPAKRRPLLFIVNLQWTPKDDLATLKINGRCDEVMELLMEELDLQIPSYNKAEDPIFHQATPLRPEEELSHTRCLIAPPAGQEDQPPDAQGHAPPAPQPVQGGWFGRGFSKGRKRKKRKAV
ncbi:NAD-dependent protein deacetylase sirtuin-7 isoform X2 [Gadus macrocephalus]|uniref:NAD-dependent protein deacetylase sirtuin-7 isoform X2 n=1 Tax=Gadus macrocephalus TaxID=80720 RepID=UPI0028CB9BBB|nr:NAD-dependent protein deacetylase sirtuin-7 isoform X2 [Gadus macrocephalus]